MKKLVIVAIAVLLAMPVLSHAGAVNNKWDMTIGGHVLMQMGWYDQDQNAVAGFKNAARDSAYFENLADWRNNFNMYSEGRLNFIIKGPDTFGAKTTGRLEMDFLTTNSNMVLRHAYMQFDWAKDTLLIGNTWFGILQSVPNGGFTLASLPNPTVPSRAPQIRWDHRWTKDFRTSFGIEYPDETGFLTGTSNNFSRSMYPNVYGLVEYKSDSCGRVGPNMLTFGLAGQYGRSAIERGTAGTIAAARGIYSNKQEDGWAGVAYAYIPIIPVRPNNNAGAFGLSMGVLAGQNMKFWPMLATPFRSGLETDEFSKPRAYGLYGAFEVYLAHTLRLAGLYSDQAAQGSQRWQRANVDSTIRTTLYNLALIYDPSPAVKFGVEYGRIYTRFAQPATAAGVPSPYAKSKGELNMFRFFAGYYF